MWRRPGTEKKLCSWVVVHGVEAGHAGGGAAEAAQGGVTGAQVSCGWTVDGGGEQRREGGAREEV